MGKWIKHDTIHLTGGSRLDLANTAPERIPLGWFRKLVNLHHSIDGQVTKRKGFGEWEDDLVLVSVPYGIFSLYRPNGDRFRLVAETSGDAIRLQYLPVGESWASIASFIPTGYQQCRGISLRGSTYITNGIDDLRFFQDASTYGRCGVWPPTSHPSTSFGSDPSTDATDDDNLDISDSGFLQYCVTFLYEDSTTGVAIHESPPSARTDLVNAHWGDSDLTYNENFGYVRRGPSLTIPTNTDIDSSIRDRVSRRRIYRRYKRYADQPWGDWTLVQEIYTGTNTTWIDVEDTPSGSLSEGNDVPPVGKYPTTAANRLFLGNLDDRAIRQPSLPATWRGGGGYTPKWPYRIPIYITDTNDKVVTRGIVEMKFTNDAAHSASKDPNPSGDGAYLLGMAGINLTTVEQDFCFVADDGVTEIGHDITGTTAVNDIFFYVEIPSLEGTALIYLFYNDTAAPALPATQWESVFHKLYADTGMVTLWSLDTPVTGMFPQSFTADCVDRVLGRRLNPSGATLVGTDGGYCDDNAARIFSSGDSYEVDNVVEYVVMTESTDATRITTSLDQGTIQLWVWIDFSELAGAGVNNDVFYIKDTADALGLVGTIEETGAGGDWYFQVYKTGPATLITDNANKGLFLDDLDGDMWLFISFAWGTANTSRAYVDSVDFAVTGPVTSVNYDSTSLDICPWRALYAGGMGAVALKGYYDEVVVYDRDMNDTSELDAMYKRLTFWGNDLQMQVGDEDEIYNVTDDKVIRDKRPSRISWSNNGAPDIFDVTDFRESDSGAAVTGIASLAGNIIVLYYNELRVLNTAYPSQEVLFGGTITEMWSLSDDKTAEISNLGCIAPDSVKATGNYVIFYGLAGLYAYAAGGFYHLSKALDTVLNDIPVSYRREIQGQVYPTGQQYWMSIPTGSDTRTDQSQTTHDAVEPFGMAAANEVRIAQSFVPTHSLLESVTLHKAEDTGSFASTVTISIHGDNSGEPDEVKVSSHTYTFAQWDALTLIVGTLDSIAQPTGALNNGVHSGCTTAKEDGGGDNDLVVEVTIGGGVITGVVVDTSGGSGYKINDTITLSGLSTAGGGGNDDGTVDVASGTFDTTFQTGLVPLNTYHIVAEAGTNVNADHPNLRYNTAGGYADGTLQQYNGTVWADVAGDDLDFTTNRAYHDRMFILDLRSVQSNPDMMRWTEYRWQDDAFFNARGFAILDDVGDGGELLVLDSTQAKIWEYDNEEYWDLLTAGLIETIAVTGNIHIWEGTLRRVRTDYQLLDSSGAHQDNLNLYIPDPDIATISMTDIESGKDELVTKGKIFNDLRFGWKEETGNDLRLKNMDFEYRKLVKAGHGSRAVVRIDTPEPPGDILSLKEFRAAVGGGLNVTFTGGATLAATNATQTPGWMIFFFNINTIYGDGKRIKIRWENVSVGVDERTQVKVYDGAYDRSSSTDFPDMAALPTKGNGLLQTLMDIDGPITQRTESWSLDLSGASLSDCCVMILTGSDSVAGAFNKPIIYEYYVTDQDSNTLITFVWASVDMELTGTYHDYGVTEA